MSLINQRIRELYFRLQRQNKMDLEYRAYSVILARQRRLNPPPAPVGFPTWNRLHSELQAELRRSNKALGKRAYLRSLAIVQQNQANALYFQTVLFGDLTPEEKDNQEIQDGLIIPLRNPQH